MKCPKCKNIIDDDSKFCSICGENLNNTEKNFDKPNENESSFILFDHINPIKRKKLLKILSIINKILNIIMILLILIFICMEIEEGMNYKFSIYVIRFLNTILPIAIIPFLIDQLHFSMTLKKSDVDSKYSSKTVILFEGVYLVLSFLTFFTYFDKSSSFDLLSLVYIIGNDEILDLLFFYKMPIFFCVLAVGLKYYLDEHILHNKINFMK